MTEKDSSPAQGDLLKALDDLTDLIAEQEQRGRVWLGAEPEEEDEAGDAIEGFDFDSDLADSAAPLNDALRPPQAALPSPAEIEAIVEQVVARRMDQLREQVAREIMIELHKRYPDL